MQFLISDTFTDSLVKLTGEEQKAVKTTAFDLQLNPANPGMQFHKLDRARDKNFWSVRVSSDIRMIVHKTDESLLLCYVDHHDPAYRWAERRKLEIHPKTGAAQLVEIRERIEEITIPRCVEVPKQAPPKLPLFAHVAEDVLLGYGVPEEWLKEVRRADEDSLLALADHLPSEAAEALLDLATGVTPQVPQHAPAGASPFDHPDAQRRFRLMSNVEELERALTYPWEKWTIFLHPAQRQLVERDYSGPARVSGSAGTGKTVVALHRAVFLTRTHPDARVLLTTFSDTLANALRTKLRRLISSEPRLGERLEVHAMDTIGRRLYEFHFGRPQVASREVIGRFLQQAAEEIGGHRFSMHFLQTEWDQVVDAWQLETWEAYRDVVRLGRRTRLPENQRVKLWSIFGQVHAALKAHNLVTFSGMFSRLASHLTESKHPPFDFTIVDEAQDVSVAQLRFLAALGGSRPNRLFFAGDLGQRIFQQPFSWKALGVDIRGRSRTLRINYRTSHQIRMQADRLLGPVLSDVDGNTEDRHNTISVFNGPEPEIRVWKSPEEEIGAVSQWLRDRRSEGVAPHEIGVFVRSTSEMDRARKAVMKSEIPYKILDENVETTSGHVSVSTMHLAKGLEFRAVIVMACDDEIIPLQERIETVADDADLQEAYDTERHLLYIACTRARDYLLITSGGAPSEFLDDLRR
ncbi:MAG: UvrD-helicase domain-containing protein [Alphaproteobacteria bacterium]|uniref:DNA 3'-5' helicase n=1 Tax=Candidatus Nitrobium versatile TaxID=2884831 RepID=A0A953M0T9_9BACT|nr:UvrD-helicase domain-containing protein [Candidatus Nitrobium versatile]